MIVGRVIGSIVFLTGLAVLVRDLLVWADTGGWAPLALGQVWFDIDRTSLNLAQAATERYVSFLVWDPIVTTILACWTFAVLIIVGAAIFASCRVRTRRRL